MTDREITVVVLGADDWPAWRTLRLEALRSDPRAFSSTFADSLTFLDVYWQERLASPRHVHLLARVDGHTVGMVGGIFGSDEGDESVAVVVGMYVSRRYRRRGVGQLLLQSLIESFLAQPGIDTIRLWVTEGQDPARELYASFGFQVVGRDRDVHGVELAMDLRTDQARTTLTQLPPPPCESRC